METKLGRAAEIGGDEVERLLAQGENPEARDEHGWTPLMRAASAGRADALTALLSAGANPAVKDHKGWTALMWAAAWGNTECARALLPLSDPKVRSYDGDTALSMSMEVGEERGCALLINGWTASMGDKAELERAIGRGGGKRRGGRL